MPYCESCGNWDNRLYKGKCLNCGGEPPYRPRRRGKAIKPTQTTVEFKRSED